MSEVLKFKGALSDLRMNRQRLVLEADTHIKHIRDIFAESVYLPVTEIDAIGAKLLVEKIYDLQGQIIRIDADIRRIEKELGQ